jgi:hypothetical protein
MGGACSAHGGDEKCIQNFGWKTLREKSILKDVGVDGKITLEWILREIVWKDLHWIRTGVGSCDNGNKPSVSIKVGEYLD